ncbi:MAG: hypothetical protein ACKO1T_02975 [Sediminibacterium sp.]
MKSKPGADYTYSRQPQREFGNQNKILKPSPALGFSQSFANDNNHQKVTEAAQSHV